MQLSCVWPPPRQPVLDENPNDDDAKSVAGSALSCRTTKTEGGSSGKKKGALHPYHWVNKLNLWEALSGPVDGRIQTQASFCIEREKRNTKNQEAAKFLQQHLAAYLLAVDLGTRENLEQQEVIDALSGLYKFNKQPIPGSICVAILNRKAKAYIDVFKLSPSPLQLQQYCEMLCPFVFESEDIRCKQFHIEQPRLCVLCRMMTPSKTAQLFLRLVADPFSTLIGNRSEFKPLLEFMENLGAIMEALPEDDDPTDEVFEAMFEVRKVLNSLESLLSCEIQADFDFAKLTDFQDVFVDTASVDKTTLIGKVIVAIGDNDVLSAKQQAMQKCMSELQKHGPTLQRHFVAMDNIKGEISLDSMKVMREAFEVFEKYKCVVPGETVGSYITMCTNKMLSIFNAFNSASKDAIEAEWLQDLQTTLQTAQRIMSTSDKFDAPIERVAELLRVCASSKREYALDKACLTFQEGKGEELQLCQRAEP